MNSFRCFIKLWIDYHSTLLPDFLCSQVNWEVNFPKVINFHHSHVDCMLLVTCLLGNMKWKLDLSPFLRSFAPATLVCLLGIQYFFFFFWKTVSSSFSFKFLKSCLFYKAFPYQGRLLFIFELLLHVYHQVVMCIQQIQQILCYFIYICCVLSPS